ncbi:cytochrome P450 [Aspergillus multicolor]|uniref:cytochrome P450 n=1 Tax=Aspergillus multicolor TaxID=41759 RepID=UPI003CCCFB8B
MNISFYFELLMTTGLIWLLSKAVYNIWFHPLRSFPGPWYSKASRLWYVLKVIQGGHKFAIQELHDRYGLVVRIAPDELSYIDPEAWNDIYGSAAHHNGPATLEKDQDFFATVFGDSDTLASASSGRYKAQKNNAVRGFSHTQLLQKENDMISSITPFVNRLQRHLGRKRAGTIDIDAWLGNLVLDLHVNLTVGHKFHAVEQGPLAHPLVKVMHRVTTVLQFSTQLLYLPLSRASLSGLRIFPRWDLFSVFSSMPPLGPAITDRLARMDAGEDEDGDEHTDFVHHMATDRKDGAISPETIKRNAFIVILSGIETLPDYISSVLFFTLSNPGCFDKLQAEIRSKFIASHEISATSVQGLKFLKACMHESLRLAPPFVGTLPRHVPRLGALICGAFVAGGTTVGIHNWSITHSKRFWKEPDIFRPERWMVSEDSLYKDDLREAFHPFGYGPRTCVAKNLVIIEASLILARILYDFDLQLHPSSQNWSERMGHLVPNKGPLFVNIKSADQRGSATGQLD